MNTMASKLCLLILCIYSTCSFAKLIKFKDCGTTPSVQSVDLTPCEEEPCQFKKGSTMNLGLTFTSAGTPASAINAKGWGIIGQLPPVPYILPQPDGCTGCNLTCPLQPGTHVYKSSLKIPTLVPDIKLIIKYELDDQDKNILSCFEFPAVVVS